VAYHLRVPILPDGGATFYEAVKALPPAHTLHVDEAGLRLRPYWSLDETTELRLPSDDAYAEGFRERIEASVRARLRSITPVGVTLSGGLDSSTISSLSAKFNPGRVHTYSAVFQSARASDERHYQQSVVDKWGLPRTEYVADGESPLAAHDDITRSIDGWQMAGNLRMNWNMYRLASEQGVGVMFEGFDGDTVVSHGLGFFGELAQRRQWLRLAVEVGTHARTTRIPVFPTVWSWWAGFRFYPLLRRYRLLRHWMLLEGAAGRLRPGRRSPEEGAVPWTSYLRPEFVQRMRDRSRRPMPPTERAHHARILEGSIQAHVCEMLNACGAAFGVDVRFPFFDRRLAEYCVSLPPELKIRRGPTRVILSRAMKGVVPDLVLSRKDKSNLEPGLEHSMRTYALPLVQSTIESGALEMLSGYVDVAACHATFLRYQQGNTSASDRLLVWQLLVMLLWLQESVALA
jgi:asparagine synthase (glutamine-hydrolysing)